MTYTYKKANIKEKRTLTINLNADINLNDFCNRIKSLYPSVEIVKNHEKTDDLLFASESILAF